MVSFEVNPPSGAERSFCGLLDLTIANARSLQPANLTPGLHFVGLEQHGDIPAEYVRLRTQDAEGDDISLNISKFRQTPESGFLLEDDEGKQALLVPKFVVYREVRVGYTEAYAVNEHAFASVASVQIIENEQEAIAEPIWKKELVSISGLGREVLAGELVSLDGPEDL